ncbi:CubicO group peptidase (beta-lactamase class C family) [Tenacibaculum lutimaris]|uniref:CubicO group peptidase (Beta-lactamase class C family) n=1 Tax=Tenacibaculum lutimaris TaxID=285258 RepID=A0A420E074_9FLAO|nr:serine hydrolase [Tenacibaculum lutimaris]RKF03501.1 CubicO group peptidase (beta-lactamase class C family) [Tenacibaculum lutimaris]
MKTLNQIKKAFVFFLCLFLTNVILAQNLELKIDEVLQSKFKNNETGAVALVAKKGNVIYRKAFGKANIELDVNMKPENVFEVGSITKQFTSVSILMLLEEGKLSLEDDITKYIPDYPTKGKRITIHHLLTHTSGIKSYTSMQKFGEVTTKDMEPLKFIDFFKNEPMDFDPGEKYLYNNSGYFILGYIIEKTSGMSYPEFVETRIFKKLNMNSSYYGSRSKLIKNRAAGYRMRNGEYSNAQYISMTLPYAAGSIMSNVDDMLKWQTAIRNNTLVKKETIDKAFTNYTLNNGKKINYGYGWSFNEINGVPTLEHGGSIPGYKSMGVYVPSEDVYVIVFSNCGCKSPTALAIKIAALAINKPFSVADSNFSISKEELNKWVGAYEFEDGAIRFISLKDNQLYSQREGSSSSFKMYPTSSNEFSFEDGFYTYKFSEKKGKKTAVFQNRINKEIGVFTDKEAPKERKEISVAPEVLKGYEGKYELQPGFIITVTSKGNQLFAQATGQSQFELFAETQTKFFLKVVEASIEFHGNENGIITALTLYQGGREMKGVRQ